jgi:hypothetical protein
MTKSATLRLKRETIKGRCFHAGVEDLQAFWDLQREAPDLQKIAAQAQHTMKPNQEREIDNERHY